MMLGPAELAVLNARLAGIAEEMGAALRRGASSPNIKERADCSAALFTADGELLVQAEHIPVHLGAMPLAVRAAIDACGATIGPGDQIVLNDPYAGGTHLNDVTIVAPAFSDTPELVGWVANRAHHADVGGATPGSMPPDATEIQQEGLRIPPVRLTPEVEVLFVSASRTPDERRGDLAAQAGANRIGVARLLELAGAPFGSIVDYGERRMRAALGRLPEGRHVFADALDEPDVAVVVTVEVADGTITFDFTGTGPQQPGNVNAVRAVTASAVAFALRSATDPTIPANGGALRPVRIVTELGTVVDARFPAAVGGGNVEVSQRVADVCLGALAWFAPDRVGAAGQGTMNNLLLGGDGWVYYETIGGGQGGRPGHAGMSGVHTAMTNTLDTPVEAIERAYPLRVLRYGLRSESGGNGAYPGGDGIVKEIEVLEPTTCTLISQRRSRPPFGLAGGAPGALGENWVLRGGEEARAVRLPATTTVLLAPGDVIRILTPGGGGYGT